MMTISFLNLNWQTVLKRYFLMMFLVILGVLGQVYWLAFLALPVFLSAILGISFGNKTETKNAKVLPMKTNLRKKTTKVV